MADFVKILNIAALVTVMLAMGMQVKFEAVTGSVRPLHRVVLGLIANFVLVPLVTLILLFLFQAAAMVSVGFLILAVCPGAPFGPIATRRAGGNVPWAIGMMVILGILSALLSPLLLSGLLGWLMPESDLHIDYLAIVHLLALSQLLPLATGLAIHHALPTLTSKIAKPVNLAGNLMLLLLIALILLGKYQMLADIKLRGWTGMGLLFISTFAIGWGCGGTDGAIRKALAVTTTSRNAALGLAIVGSNFAETAAVTAVVAYALVSIFGTIIAGMLLGKCASASEGGAVATPSL